VDAAGKEVGELLGAAGIKHGGHLYSGHLFEQFGRQLWSAADAGGAVHDLARFFLGQGDQAFDVADAD